MLLVTNNAILSILFL